MGLPRVHRGARGLGVALAVVVAVVGVELARRRARQLLDVGRRGDPEEIILHVLILVEPDREALVPRQGCLLVEVAREARGREGARAPVGHHAVVELAVGHRPGRCRRGGEAEAYLDLEDRPVATVRFPRVDREIGDREFPEVGGALVDLDRGAGIVDRAPRGRADHVVHAHADGVVRVVHPRAREVVVIGEVARIARHGARLEDGSHLGLRSVRRVGVEGGDGPRGDAVRQARLVDPGAVGRVVRAAHVLGPVRGALRELEGRIHADD